MSDLRADIAENARRLRELNRRVRVAYRTARAGPSHAAAADAFRAEYDALAFPGGLTAMLTRLKRLDPGTVEEALQFLEVDPFFHRSGYIKEVISRRLKHAHMTEEQRDRLRQVVLRAVRHSPARVFRHYARLASRVTNASFWRTLEQLASQEPDRNVTARVARILQVLDFQSSAERDTA